MSFDPDTPGLIPVDQVFQSLLAKARGLAAARERLEATDAARAAKAALEANRIAQRYEWKPRAAVAMVEEQVCTACGSVQQTFRGFGVSMRRAADGTERIVGAHGLDQGLPTERYIIHSQAEACMECLPERGI
jgi:hypothetical protein